MSFAVIMIFFGLLFLSWSVDGIAKQMRRQNKLYEAELRSKGVTVDSEKTEEAKV